MPFRSPPHILNSLGLKGTVQPPWGLLGRPAHWFFRHGCVRQGTPWPYKNEKKWQRSCLNLCVYACVYMCVYVCVCPTRYTLAIQKREGMAEVMSELVCVRMCLHVCVCVCVCVCVSVWHNLSDQSLSPQLRLSITYHAHLKRSTELHAFHHQGSPLSTMHT